MPTRRAPVPRTVSNRPWTPPRLWRGFIDHPIAADIGAALALIAAGTDVVLPAAVAVEVAIVPAVAIGVDAAVAGIEVGPRPPGGHVIVPATVAVDVAVVKAVAVAVDAVVDGIGFGPRPAGGHVVVPTAVAIDVAVVKAVAIGVDAVVAGIAGSVHVSVGVAIVAIIGAAVRVPDLLVQRADALAKIRALLAAEPIGPILRLERRQRAQLLSQRTRLAPRDRALLQAGLEARLQLADAILDARIGIGIRIGAGHILRGRRHRHRERGDCRHRQEYLVHHLFLH